MNKLLLILFFSIFLVGSINALDLGSIKNYDLQTKTITISSNLGIPLLGSTIGTASLKTPDVYYVQAGYQKIAEFTINSNEDYSEVIKGIRFIDLKTNKEISKPFDIKYLVSTTPSSKSCNILKNGTNECIVTPEKQDWEKLPSLDFKSGESYTIGIFTNVGYGDKIEWIPTLFGKEINEWAIYEEVVSPLETQTGGTYTVLGGYNYSVNTSVYLYAVKVNTTVNGVANGLTDAWLCDTTTCNTVYEHASKVGSAQFFNFSGLIKLDPAVNSGTYYIMVNTTGAAVQRGQGVAGFVLPTALKYGSIGCIVNPTAGSVCQNTGWYIDINNIYVDTSPSSTYFGQVNLLTPSSGTIVNMPIIQDFVANNTVTAGNLTNSTLYIWYLNGTLFGKNTTSITGQFNVTNLSLENLSQGKYLWNELVYFTNLTGGNISRTFAVSNYTYSIGSNVTAVHYNASAPDTSLQNFSIDITAFNGTTPTNPILNYNGTTYSGSVINNSGGNFTFYKAIDIPSQVASNTANFNFSWTDGGVIESSNSYSQIVNPVTFSYCQASPYINFTVEDEGNQSILNWSISTSSFNFWLGDGSIYKTFTYSNNTQNVYYSFCFSNTSLPVNVNYSINYGSTSYPFRTVQSTNELLSSTTTNTILYLLTTSQGQIVTFQIVNSATQPLSGVYGTVTKIVSGSPVLVGAGTSGEDGGISFFLNPLTQYSFSFSKAGYTTFTETTYPTQTGYTITLTGSGSSTNDYTQGITQTISPTVGELNNGTFYIFNYTISSSFWTLQSFNFTLTGQNGTVLGSNSSTLNGGSIWLNVSTLNYTSITMNYFYVINGTTTSSSVTWIIVNSQGTQYSISNFFNDAVIYLTGGLFGSTNFSVALIVFLIILLGTGTVSYKFGFTSPASIIAILAGLVVFFDVGLGLDIYMNPAPGAVPYFPSVVMLIVAISMILRESSR